MKIDSFALDGATPARSAASTPPRPSNCRRPQPDPAKPSDYVARLMWQAGTSGDEGEYDDDLAPALISQHWLVSKDTAYSSCGGAHPNGEVDWRLDRTTGAAVDAWSWFTADAAVYSKDDPAGRASRSAQAAASRRTLAGQGRLQGRAGRPGLLGRASDAPRPRLLAAVPERGLRLFEDVVIPYADLAPLLNAKRMLRSRQDRRVS